jgi:hypothetical protein
MKTILTVLLLCGVYYGYAQNTPPHAASTKTWKFGTQTWSDAIEMRSCNHTLSNSGDNYPACCSYSDGLKTWYFYNRTYLNWHKDMCPTPWRVPTKEDFETLLNSATANRLYADWGARGMLHPPYPVPIAALMLWSSSYDVWGGWALYIGINEADVDHCRTAYLFQVRCVK